MSTGTATFDFSGAKVLVTGGTSGIGFATATVFADAGAHVTITGTRAASNDYDTDLGYFEYRQLRVQDNDEILSVANSISELDVLVNNAGMTKFSQSDDVRSRIDVFEELVRVHLISGNNLAEACLDKLSASQLPGGASIVSIASLTSFLAHPVMPGYGAGKAGMVQLAKTQALAWAKRGIRSNCVAAGNIATPMWGSSASDPDQNHGITAGTPLKRWGRPEEIADAVLFLSSDKAAFITGETILVDGGYLVDGY